MDTTIVGVLKLGEPYHLPPRDGNENTKFGCCREALIKRPELLSSSPLYATTLQEFHLPCQRSEGSSKGSLTAAQQQSQQAIRCSAYVPQDFLCCFRWLELADLEVQ